VATGELLFKASVEGGHQYDVWAAGASADGKWFATGGRDKKVRVWDAASGKTVRELPSSWMNEKNIEFSKDGKFLFCPDIDHKTIVKWNIGTGEEAMRFAYKKDTPVQSLWAYCLTSDGKTMVAASSGERRDGGMLVGWDVETGEQRFQKPIDDPNLMMFPVGQFSPDGKFFSGMFKLMSVDDPKKMLLPDRKRGSHLPGVFSSDGKRILFTEYADDARQKWLLGVYDIETGKRLLDLPVPSHVTAAISPDGKTLAVAGAKDISFHDAATGKEYARWNSQFINPHGEHNSFARSVQFTSDGKRIITTHNDTAPLVWSVPPRGLVSDHGLGRLIKTF
jgi:WD40 repeat protein